MIEISIGSAIKLPVLLVSYDQAVKEITDIGISCSKNLDTFAEKQASGSWTEIGNGLYAIDFSAEELDTEGFFVYAVSGSGFDQFTGLVYVKP